MLLSERHIFIYTEAIYTRTTYNHMHNNFTATTRFANDTDIKQLLFIVNNKDTEERTKVILYSRIGKQQLLCVIVDSVVVGFLGWEKNYNNNPTSWFIEQITIDSNYRKQGLGTYLMEEFLKLAKLDSISSVYATIQKDNQKSLALFTKVGGEIIGSTNNSEYLLQISLN